MKVYLVCVLDDEHYRDPDFYFFKTAFEAHKWIIDSLVSITEGSMEEVTSNLDYRNVDGSDDQIMRIDYSYGDGEFYVNTIHEIEIKDGDYLCIYHHAYEGVGFYVEKIGTLEECKNHMLDSTAKMANDYDIDITNDDIFEVNSFDSCVDDDIQWHMCDIIQFKVNEIMQNDEEKTKSDKSDSAELNKNVHKYDAEIYEELRDYMYGPIPGYGSSSDHVETSLEEIIKDIDASPKHEIFKNLCNYHGIAPSTVEYLYESIWGKPKDKTVGYFLEKKSIN
ncbi:MAG: hypothetical protein [Bacteriophage sp.]|nr:MAG: hypothetical protein [Bacteriophage sp.]